MESMIEKIRELALPIVQEEGLELFHLEFKRSGYKWFLRVYLDREGGINLNDCEVVSKRLSAKLDLEDFIPYSYTLEVSSPGLDRPLLSERDYKKFKGKHVRIKTLEAIDGQRNFKGRLANYYDGIITLEMEIKKNLGELLGGIVRIYLPQNWIFKTESEIVTLRVDKNGNTIITDGPTPNPDVTIEVDHEYICEVLKLRGQPSFRPKFYNVTPHTKNGRTAFNFMRKRFGL